MASFALQKNFFGGGGIATLTIEKKVGIDTATPIE